MAGPVIYIGPVRTGIPHESGRSGLCEVSGPDPADGEVYGEPSAHLLKQLEEKARMLGGGAVSVHELQGGLSRLG